MTDAALPQRASMRGIRLQLNYWKAGERRQIERIGHAVVIYGSTRIVAPTVANARLGEANRLLAERPHHSGRSRTFAIASRLAEDSMYYPSRANSVVSSRVPTAARAPHRPRS